MVRILTQSAGESTLAIDQSILDQLHITPGTPLKISIDGQKLIIEPVDSDSGDREGKFVEAVEQTNREYARMFKRLAE